MRQTSDRLASLASRTMKGYYPTRPEVLSLAASVLSQVERERGTITDLIAEDVPSEIASNPGLMGWLKQRLGL